MARSSQFADHQSVDVGRRRPPRCPRPSACCATTSAATAAPMRPPASTRSTLLIADVIALMDALSIKRAHFGGISMGGMTALVPGPAPSRPASTGSSPATAARPSTPQTAQQWKERIDLGAEEGHGAAGRATVGPLVSARLHRKPSRRYLDKVRAMIRTTPDNGFAGCAAALADHNYAAAVATGITARCCSSAAARTASPRRHAQ